MNEIIIDGKKEERAIIADTFGLLFGWVKKEKVGGKKGVAVVNKKEAPITVLGDTNESQEKIMTYSGLVLVARACDANGNKLELTIFEVEKRLKEISKKVKVEKPKVEKPKVEKPKNGGKNNG